MSFGVVISETSHSSLFGVRTLNCHNKGFCCVGDVRKVEQVLHLCLSSDAVVLVCRNPVRLAQLHHSME